ncbi:hypothetical protein EV424DRAFT_1535012 [Suillus variegatus]|nr:hypothetical protein EV424DRAFT_1535012 [Suillus variegatus]
MIPSEENANDEVDGDDENSTGNLDHPPLLQPPSFHTPDSSLHLPLGTSLILIAPACLMTRSEYKTKLTEGAIVELEVILKLWTIKPRSNNASNPRDANGSRVYQMMLQHMQLLPCEKYMQAAFVNSIKDGREKRKATDEASEAMGQSPAKKGSFSAGVGDELEYMEE